ncbi:beta-galactosidase [Hoeflea sp. IMCC20628]|uniref:beta-galactosidase n=1 Tax=Hoeflea sp. IMCC20628 TaxID=1620421 RepID=UPI00063AE481|nr:beta-galactosidase [Hoeflea sp. IMCC20628]AKI01696.1 beta-galactosidase [Hoeflea sp. IMCC20628]
MQRTLGVCYYPEHWPETQWAEDAARMAALGLTFVRIGEFAWSRLEPKRGAYDFDWLERSINTLHAAGLKVVLGTPTATPPKWLVDEMPDMLPVGADGLVRKFGSRRHYDFSHDGYLEECKRITLALAKAFGAHPGVAAWQTDNEYDCHNTTLSYSPAARAGFQAWLQQKYQSPNALNRAWGNVFWSMELSDFGEIDLPNLTVTEANPAHVMDFRRYASDMVVRFNKAQADIIRTHSPGRDVIHNFMGRTLAFDHFAVGADLDISSWDSYPLGFLEDRSDQGDAWKQTFARAGDPDFQAFHHDLYRATSKGRWWVMEQQPGPVNWAPHNPAPRDGMVRLWSWEAFAHGAETVSYFRWRQAPFAQEQMHAGLLRPDSSEAEGYDEAAQVAADLGALDAVLDVQPGKADVAIVFDYPSGWAWEIQPQGREFDYFRLVFDFYRSLRKLGLSVDIVPASAPQFAGYPLVVIPGLFSWSAELIAALRAYEGALLIGPRSGSKTVDFAIPDGLPPALPRDILDMRVTRIETLRADTPVQVTEDGMLQFWREFIETGSGAKTIFSADDGIPALVKQGNLHYLGGWPDQPLMHDILQKLANGAGLLTNKLNDGVRLRRHGNHIFAFNYGASSFDLSQLGWTNEPLLGKLVLEPSGVAVAPLQFAGY